MRDVDRRAVLTNGLTATAATIGAATLPAMGQPSAPITAPATRSPRARRLNDLLLRIDGLYAADAPEDEINAIAREVYALMDEIEARPATGLAALEEYAASVRYWYRPGQVSASGVTYGGIEVHEGCPVTIAVMGLVNAAISVAAGGVAHG